MSDWNARQDGRWHVRVLHGAPCPGGRRLGDPDSKCRAQEGAVLIETWHTSQHSYDMEVKVTADRVADPLDHAGSFEHWGPAAPSPWTGVSA